MNADAIREWLTRRARLNLLNFAFPAAERHRQVRHPPTQGQSSHNSSQKSRGSRRNGPLIEPRDLPDDTAMARDRSIHDSRLCQGKYIDI